MTSATSPTHADAGDAAPRVSIVGLVTAFHAPEQASPRTRVETPSGYGVREHCLPFVEAAACGLAIPSPFSWGVCDRSELPEGSRSFRSPVPSDLADDRCCYVIDDPHLSFRGNQFRLTDDVVRRVGRAPIPGLSFFDRSDQMDMLKIHLPYSWRTPESFATLFLPPLNRHREDALLVIAGLVETAWYANPVNLVVQIPPAPAAVHVTAGEHLAHAVLIPRSAKKPEIEIVESHRRDTRHRLDDIAAWRESLARHRNAYKRSVVARRRSSPVRGTGATSRLR